MKRILIVSAFIIIIGVVVATIGCSASVKFTTASISEATMCKDVDSQFRPVNATDVFGVDTYEIFCSFKLSNAPPDTEIKADWIYVKGEVEGLTNYLIGDWHINADGTRYVNASLTIPDKGWPRGDYKVVLSINGKERQSVPFTVK